MGNALRTDLLRTADRYSIAKARICSSMAAISVFGRSRSTGLFNAIEEAKDLHEDWWARTRLATVHKRTMDAIGNASSARAAAGAAANGSAADDPYRWVGRRLYLFWVNDIAWYIGTVRTFNQLTRRHFVVYDDGVREWVDLSKELCHLPGEPRPDVSHFTGASPAKPSAATKPKGKGRRGTKQRAD